jgi:hypothetical protein
MKKCLVDYYIDSETGKAMWSCNEGLSKSVHPITSERCWRYNCPGIKKQDFLAAKQCNYLNCVNLIRNSKKAKYCSLKCKSKESSRRYRLKSKTTL